MHLNSYNENIVLRPETIWLHLMVFFLFLGQKASLWSKGIPETSYGGQEKPHKNKNKNKLKKKLILKFPNRLNANDFD